MNQLHLEAGAQLSQERKALSLVGKTIDKNKDSGKGYTLAGINIQLALMWLGKAKGALGIKTPYPESFNAASDVIENQADESFDELVIPKDLDNVGKTKFFRNELNKLELSIINDSKIMPEHKAYQFCIANALTNCCEATMWLGDSLNDIKATTPKKEKKEEKPESKKLDTALSTELPKHDPNAEVGQIPAPSDFVNQDLGRLVGPPEKIETPEDPAPTSDEAKGTTGKGSNVGGQGNDTPSPGFVSSREAHGSPQTGTKAPASSSSKSK